MGILQTLKDQLNKSKKALGNLANNAVSSAKNSVNKQVSEAQNIVKNKSIGATLMPASQFLAAKQQLPKPVQKYANEGVKPRVDNTVKYLPPVLKQAYQAGEKITTGILNIPKAILFGDTEDNKRNLEIFDKARIGIPLSDYEKKKLEDFASDQMLNFVGSVDAPTSAKGKVPGTVPKGKAKKFAQEELNTIRREVEHTPVEDIKKTMLENGTMNPVPKDLAESRQSTKDLYDLVTGEKTAEELGLNKNLDNVPGTKPKETLTTLKDVKIDPQELNVNNLLLTMEQKLDLKELGAKDIRSKLSDEQIREIAKKSGLDLNSRTPNQTATEIAEQMNVRRKIVDLENVRTELMSNGGDQNTLKEITSEIRKLTTLSASQGTDLARQLRARHLIADELKTPMQRVFKMLDEAGVNPEAYADDAAKVDFKNPQEAVDFFRKYVPSKFGDWLDSYRYTNMLSSFNTHLYNISSNLQGTGVIAPIEKTIAGGVDFLSSKITGSPRKQFAGEGAKYVEGYFSNIRNASKNFAEVMKGVKSNDILELPDLPLTGANSGKVSKAAESTFTFVTKLLKAQDAFFQTLTEGGATKALEYRSSKGVNVDNIADVAFSEGRNRLFNKELGAAGENSLLQALDFVPKRILEARSNKNPIVKTIASIAYPFVKVPQNIIKQSVEYSPAGFLTAPGSLNPNDQVAKAIMGSSVALGASVLATSGRLTGKLPSYEKERLAYESKGIQPYSIKVGDKWVSYQRMHPAIAANLAAVATLSEAYKSKVLPEDQIEKLGEMVAGFVSFLADQSTLKTTGEIINAASGDAGAATRYAASIPQQFVPFRAFFSWLERATDPYVRQVDPDGSGAQKILQQIMKEIPGLSESVPVKKDISGRDVENTNRLINAVNPIGKMTTEVPSPKSDYYLKELNRKRVQRERKEEKLKNGAKAKIPEPKPYN